MLSAHMARNAVMMEKSDNNIVKFMHPENPSSSFHLLHKGDMCWVEMGSM
jgi:hypothetical protein